MEYSSSWEDEDFVLEFSDDECSNTVDQRDNYGNIDQIRRDSQMCESSHVKLDYTQPKEENYYASNDVKIIQPVERKNNRFVDEEKKQKFLSQYLTSPKNSQEKQQEVSQSLENGDSSERMVNFSKLINQLFNAKVVIERMSENFGTNEQSEKKHVLSKGSRLRDSVQRYCPECQTVTVDTRAVSTTKSCACPRCESTLKFLCPKCNSKHYTTYNHLKRHWKNCRPTDSTLQAFKPDDFLVKKTEIDWSKEIIRYCSKCDEVDGSCNKTLNKVCQNCDQYLLYQCKKCKARYTAYSSLSYHMRTRCYPHRLYECNQCDFTSLAWGNMSRHVLNIHFRESSIIVLTSKLSNAKVPLPKLEEPLTVSRHTDNVDGGDRKDSAGEINCDEYAQRYCATCKKTKFARIDDPMAKSCSDCKTAMTYLCTICNEKHYRRYPYLLSHLVQCKGGSIINDSLKSHNARTKLTVTDKNASKLYLDKSEFIVREFDSVSTAKKWKRYCPKCGIVTASFYDRRCTCGESIFFTCAKCHISYNKYQSLLYHLESHCFPIAQYRCTHCKYSITCWSKMQKHFRRMHTDLPLLKCECCSYETKWKNILKRHTKRMHSELNKLVAPTGPVQ